MFKRKEDYEQLCSLLGYQFRNKRLLAQAITTKSAYNSRKQQSSIGHQEQLEFLGDSLLRLVVDQILMEEFPHAMPDELSRLRDRLVKNANLSQAAKQLGLAPYIIMDQNQARQCEHSDSSKVLADTMEALICAIYKDSNNSLNLVKEFILTNSMISQVLNDYRDELSIQYLPLVQAIEMADLTATQKLLQQKYNPNLVLLNSYQHIFAIEEEHFTALSLAVSCLKQLAQAKQATESMIAIIDLLIRYGADPNLRIKKQPSLAHDLIPGLTYDGLRTDTHFYRFRKETSQDLKLDKEFAQTHEKHEIPDWLSITDRVMALFCKAGLDFTMQDAGFNTLLTLAAIFNQSRKIDLFLQGGADINYPNQKGETALHIAAAMGNSDLVQRLLKFNAQAGLHNKSDETPFDVAKTSAIKYLLLKAELTESSQIQLPQPENLPMLNKQAIQLYSEGIKNNLAQNVAKSIPLFETVLKHLHIASTTPATQLISAYFNLGSAYFQRGNSLKAKPFLERAYILCLYEIGSKEERTLKIKQRLELCIEKPDERPTHPFMAQNRHTTFANNVPSLAKQKIEEQDNKLFEAVEHTQAKEFKALLNSGANPDACNEKGQNILSYAIQQYATASLMYSSVAHIFDYPEMSASYHQKQQLEKIIQLLLQWKADVNQRDAQGQTALHQAAIIGDLYIVTQLLNAQADPTISDYKGNYPSHLAANKTIKTILLKALQAGNTRQTTLEYDGMEQKLRSFTL